MMNRLHRGILEINHELGACPLITSSPRKCGSILSWLDSHFHGNDKATSGNFAISFETAYLSCERVSYGLERFVEVRGKTLVKGTKGKI